MVVVFLISELELGLLFFGDVVMFLNMVVNFCMNVDFLYLEFVVILMIIVCLLVVL